MNVRRTAAVVALVAAAVPGVALAAPSVSGPSVSAQAAVAAASSSAPLLHVGSTGAAVVEVQDRLRSSGYTALITGYYGTMTRDAVTAFQRDHGLVADGLVGPRTWDVLRDTSALPSRPVHPTLSVGSHGDAVAQLQGLLDATHVVPTVRVDGMYGAATRASVVAFQREVRIPADGIAGPRTWAMLVNYTS